MGVWVDGIGGTLLDAGLAAATLLGVVALAMAGCRQPARRRVLARAALVGALALGPLIATGWTGPRLDVLGPVRAILGSAMATHARDLDGPTVDHAHLGRGGLATRQAVRVAVLGYGLGVGAGLAGVALGWWGSGWLVRRARPPSPTAQALLEGLTGGRARPRLRVCGRIGRPVLVGLLRPTILVPEALDRPGAEDRLRLSLLHELAHHRAGDAWFGLVGSLAGAFWFFVPAVGWIRRQLRLDQEFLADLRASGAFGPPGQYARSLVEIAAPEPEARPLSSPPEGAAGGRPFARWGADSALLQRILVLVRCPFVVEPRAPRWWCWSIPPLVAGATVLASGLTLRGPEPAHRPRPSGAMSTPGRFDLDALMFPACPPGPGGSVRPVRLGMPLPGSFELSAEVWADPVTLGRMALVGQRLGPAPSPWGPPESTPPTWHLVRLRRDPEGLSLWVDGHPQPTTPVPSSPWLTVEPAPYIPLQIQNLRLAWDPPDPA